MKVEYVSPFVNASAKVFAMVANVEPERGQLGVRPQMFTTQQVNVVCGITGAVEGVVIYGMSIVTASRLAARMIGEPVPVFDAMAQSAISELANMISGNSMSLLSDQGFNCDITPPSIIRGNNVRMSTNDIPAILIPLNIAALGVVEINVCLRERLVAAAA